MSAASPGVNSLVLYKRRPARVMSVADKLEIELEDGRTQRVRPKDVFLLHPGPLRSLGELDSPAGEVEDAWELLAGSTTRVAELAELVFGEHTPATSWAAWQLVNEGFYFQGTTPEEVRVRSEDELAQERRQREEKAAEAQAWADLLARLKKKQVEPGDADRLKEVEAVALGSMQRSRILRELGLQETPESAHALLLRLGVWDPAVNPYPRRLKLPAIAPDADIPPLGDEQRRDLTHLPTFAIDDEGNQDPDDAISLDGDRLWVHVADVAALAAPDGPLDREARGRGATQYLPEGIIPMLPAPVTEQLGLGLLVESPALSFGIRLQENGEIREMELTTSRVKVRRLSYAEAERHLAEDPFRGMLDLTRRYRARRKANGAAFIDLPEVRIRLVQGDVTIQPLPRFTSRDMITDAMLMAGEAAARFAEEHAIPFPFTTQAPPETSAEPRSMAEMFAYRKQFKRSQVKGRPEPHAGLGLALYAQATSPLRRYQDLLAHQQLRAFLSGDKLLDRETMLERIASTDMLIGSVRQGERLSNRHWTLVHLQRHPDWQGEAVIVDKRDRRARVLIPELGLDGTVPAREDLPLDTVVRVRCTRVSLPEQIANFQITETP